MPSVHVERRSPINRSFRVEQGAGMFDVPHQTEIRHEWDASLPIEEKPWQIGLIVGPSGAGKSVLGRELFPDALFIDSAFAWPESDAVLDGFARADGVSPETREIVSTLSAVGLSSPPHWLKRYGHLSNGQRFRCDLARALLSGRPQVVFDEFTSVVDRDVAKICSAAVATAIRKRADFQFVALSCHFDIVEWLQPDWVYDVAAARFEWRQLRRRPPITLDLHRVDAAEAWPLFRQHHYLSHSLSLGARCYGGFWGEKPIAFYAVIPQPGRVVRAWRGHRWVILPDYQGVGLGNLFQEAIARIYLSQNLRFYFTTSHPAVMRHCQRVPIWRMVRHPKTPMAASSERAYGTQGGATGFGGNSRGRLTASFEFVGP